jgi:arylsulfatase A-like enzyme
MKSKRLLRVWITALFFVAVNVVRVSATDLVAGSRAADPVPPNVLLLMTDEQHFRSLSLTGNPYVQTPHMDRIGREGVVFRQATCVTPYCSPSRASLITGRYPHQHGILRNVTPHLNDQKPLDPKTFPTLETILHERGYQVFHRGKWHLGDKGDFPCYESFAYASKVARDYRNFLQQQLPVGTFRDHPSPAKYLGRPVEMIQAVREGFEAFHEIPNNRVAYISIIGRSVIPPELLPETQITEQILQLLEENSHHPFMITASWSPPHDLWVVPEPYYSLVNRQEVELPGSLDVPRWDRRGPSKRLGDLMGPDGLREYAAIYHGMVKYIDDQVGRVLRKLDELELADNTLVIFVSDHGDMVGAHGCVGKSIFSFYDDLVRIPLLMRMPGRIEAGRCVLQPVSQIDVLPTVLDYLGFPSIDDVHGRSLRPLIEDPNVPWRDYAFCQRADAARMIRTERYKFTYRPQPPIVALYDLTADPHEDHNLAQQPEFADIVQKMHQRLLDVMTADGDPMLEKFRRSPVAPSPK